MKKPKFLPIATAIALALMISPARAADKTNVVASFYPIYAMAANLLAGVAEAELTCLAAPNAGCLHDKALLPSDMRALSGADIMLINGAGMEGYLEDVIAQFPRLTIADASEGIALLPEAGHDDHEAGHDHGHYNAHIWLDAQNAAKMTETLAEALARAMPSSADAIFRNRDAYAARLAALDAEIKQALAPFAGSGIVTFHAAFDYFAKAYGLSVTASMTSDPESPPSAGELAELCEMLIERGLPPLFTESAYLATTAEVLRAETGVSVYELDTATTGDLGQAALSAYENAMRGNAATLAEALK